MKNTKRILMLMLFLSVGSLLQAQSITQQRLNNFKALISYLKRTDDACINTDTLTKNYVDVNYILSDTDTGRVKKRMQSLLMLSQRLKSPMMPFSHGNAALIPFAEVKDASASELKYLKDTGGDVYGYYPNGAGSTEKTWLLFRPGEVKVASWLLIDQGGYLYFLMLNLL